MAKKDIAFTCDGCGGSGKKTGSDFESGDPIETTCTKCTGSGKVIRYSLDQDLIDEINDIKDKVNDIKEKVDEM